MNGILAAGFESFFRLIVTLFMFIFVVIVCYIATVWIGNFQKNKIGKGNIEVIEIHRITNNKYIEIVRIGKKYYVLSVSKDRIDKIDILEEDDIILPENTSANVNENFAQIFEKLKNRKHQQDKE